MKTKITILLAIAAAFVFAVDIANAQSSSSNNTYSAGNFLGWGTTSGDLLFKVNNTTAMTLQNTTGYFGIGASSPTYPLQVNSTVNAGTLSSGNNFMVGYSHDLIAAIGEQSTTRYAIFGTTQTNSDILFANKVGGTYDYYERMRIASNGNVGIATSTPGSILQLLNTTHTNPNTGYSSLFAGTFSTMFRATASDCYLFANSYYTNAATHIYAANGGASSIWFNGSGAGNIDFYTAPSGTAGGTITYTKRMTLLQNGNLGIGTGSPSYLLTLLGANPQIAITNSTAGGESSIFYDANTAGKSNWYVGHNENSIGTGNFGFYATSYGQVMTMLGNNGNVGIGTASPACKLDVETNSNTEAVLGVNSSTSGSSYGGWFQASGAATQNIGLFVSAGSATTSNYELYLNGLAAGANNYALFSPAAAQSYFAGNVGIGSASAPTHALEVNSTSGFNLNGPFSGTGANSYTSDQMFKTHVDSIHSALNTIKQLKPRSFYFDTTNIYGFNFPSEKNYGFIAQDLEQVVPELVTSITKHADIDTSGNVIHPAVTYKAVYYVELISILTKGIQELQQKNDSLQLKTNKQDSINASLQNQAHQSALNDSLLQNQLNLLTAAINNCCSHSMQSHTDNNQQTKSINIDGAVQQSETAQTDVKLNDIQTVILEQNVPNPFAEQTTINYALPDNTVKAQMLFYNSQGKLIQSVDLVQTGKGQLNVFASDLSNGIYTYTLVVDGKIIDTKKMVKQ